jgi:hypothetical protein
MDPVPFAIAAVPMAIYLLVLGVTNLRRTPRVVSGTWEIAALALAVTGLLIVGPINLLLPQGAVVRLGVLVWPLVITFYALCVVLWILIARPRLVIYNISLDQFRPILEQSLRRLDSEAKIAGDAIQSPQLGLQFHLEVSGPTRNVSLVSIGDHQSYSGWVRLRKELTSTLAAAEVPPNPRGFSFLAIAAFLIGWPAIQLLQLPHAQIAQKLFEMLRL